MTQKSSLRDYIIKHKEIDARTAYEMFGCMRLSARIWDFEHKEGMRFDRENRIGKNRYGRTVPYKLYRLVESD